MAIEGFLKIPGVRGESTRRDHEDEIEVRAINFAFSAQVSAASTRQRTRVSSRPIMFTKFFDRSSPYLKQALAQHHAWLEVVLTLTRPEQDLSGTGATEDYLVVTLKEMTPTDYTLTSSDDARLEESLSFSYRSIHFVYQGQYEVELHAVDTR